MFADWIEDSLRSIEKHYEYKMVFTGHSLGGALAIHAAMDMLLEEFIPDENFKVYTYGQPRVGNKAFEEVLRDRVEEAYRVTHN